MDSVSVQFSYDQAIKHVHNPVFDPLLLDGDIVQVGKYSNLVKIFTFGVNNAVADTNFFFVNYAGKYNAKYYINNFAGGFSSDFEKTSLYVVKANGRIVATKKVGFFTVYPIVESGDQIHIAEFKKIKLADENKKEFSWDNLFSKLLTLSSTAAIVYYYTKQ